MGVREDLLRMEPLAETSFGVMASASAASAACLALSAVLLANGATPAIGLTVAGVSLAATLATGHMASVSRRQLVAIRVAIGA